MQNPLSRSVKMFGCLIFISAFLLTQSVVAQNDPQIKKGENSLSIKSGDQTRHFLLYIPEEYDSKTPLPLVLLFHGTGTSSKSVMRATGFSEVAQKKKFIVAAPDGIYVYGGRNGWNYQLVGGGINDVELVKELIKEIISKVAVDKKRIYAAGYSAGAGMSYSLSCELSNVFAAIGVVASAPFNWDCITTRSVSVIAFHGTHDALTPYTFGENSFSSWVKTNVCNKTPETRKISEDVTQITYGGCKDKTEGVIFRINEGGHTWPGSPIAEVYEKAGLGKVNKDINATNLIWSFFESHPMP